MTDRLVVFTPSGLRGRFADGVSLLDAARRLGVDLDSVCGGRGICGRCQVVVAEGEFAKHGIVSRAGHVSAADSGEKRFLASRGASSVGRRLGCRATISGDLVVDVPADSQVHRQVVRKAADSRAIDIDPVVRLHYVEVARPDMDDPASDFRRLSRALAAQWGISGAQIDRAVLAGLQPTLRQANWSVTVALRQGREVVAVRPGLIERAYGVAIDIGSTTIAAHLCDLASGEVVASGGRMNPQIRFGEDLMSRVSYVMMNPGGAGELTQAVREAVDALVGELASQARIARDDVVEACVVGNPIMHHLFLGLDPTELGQAPFALALDHGIDLRARELGLAIAPGAFVYVLPCIAGHVGADCAGVVLAEAPHAQDSLMLVVDVGTNAEIVLGNRTRLLACSSPTGPAFEGAQVSSGQRAAPGAIERVRIDPATLEPRFKVIGSERWSNEPGFEAAVRGSGVTGICGSGIIEVIAEMFLAGILRDDGTIDGTVAARSPRIVADGRTFAYVLRESNPRLAVTQNDVRAIQLAKAALHAGVKLLMDRWGADAVDSIRLAGAFGSHIDVVHAMVLGMIPDCDPQRVASVGNAAGTGARIALLNAAARAEIEALVARIEKVETATEKAFQAHFVEAMAIPHRTDPYRRLRAAVTLPEASAASADSGRRGRRRRGALPERGQTPAPAAGTGV